MRLWILDTDVIIDLLEMGVFDKLADLHEIHTASSVIDEVQYYWKEGRKVLVDFRNQYIQTGLVEELSASADEIRNVLSQLPPLKQDALDPGELESLAVLVRDHDLIFCSRDAAAIRAMPFLDVTERGISVEFLLRSSGLQIKDLKDYHTDEYLKSNLSIGQMDKLFRWTP